MTYNLGPRSVAAALACASLVACQQTLAAAPQPLTERRASIDVDVGAIVERARTRFRAEGAELRATSRSWDVTVQPDGFVLRGDSGTHATFRTRGVCAGAVEAGLVAPDDQGRGRIRRGPTVVETIDASDAGAEQSWTFATRPDDDVTVRVEVRGVQYFATTEHGLHFRSEASEVGLRYGVATWIDARGERTIIHPQWSGEHITIAVPRAVVARSAYPAILDPIISPEIELDQPMRQQARPGVNATDVAYGSGVHLVVWTQPAIANATVSDSIRAVRVRASDGVVLDSTPIVIATQRGSRPAVAADGAGNFLVAYDGLDANGAARILARRVRAADGAVLDATDRVVSASGRSGAPEVSFNGGRFLVAWMQGTPGSRDIYGRFIDAAGAQIGADDLVLAGAPEDETQPSLCAAGTRSLLVFTSNGALQARRIDPATAALIDTTDITVPGQVYFGSRPRCAGDGATFLIAWLHSMRGVQLTRLAAATGVPDAAPVMINSGRAERIELGFDGTNYLVAWSSGPSDDIFAQRVAPDLTFLNAPAAGVPVRTTTSAEPLAGLSIGGGSAELLWLQHDATADVYGMRIDTATLAPLDLATRFTFTASEQIQAAVAYAAGNYLVTWYDQRRSGAARGVRDLVGVRVRASDGAILDASPIMLVEDVRWAYWPAAIATDGTTFFVGSYRYFGETLAAIVARRVRSSDGALLGAEMELQPMDFISADLARQPRLAASYAAGNYLLVHPRYVQRPRLDPISSQVVVSRVDAISGAVITPATTILDDSTRAFTRPSIACLAGSCLVASDALDPANASHALLGARIDPATGAALDAAPLVLRPTMPGASAVAATALATDGRDYLLVWQSESLEIRARVLTSSAAIPSPSDALIATGRGPAVSFDGSVYYVSWSQLVGRTYQIHAARVLADGTPIDPVSLVIGETGLTTPQTPEVASEGAGRSMIAYSRMVTDTNVFAPRVFARIISAFPLGASCSDADDCATGFCVDGVCCNAACGGDDRDDCQACSIATGASQEGICALRPAATVCRAADNVCDPIEYCSGSAPLCPPDLSVGACADAGEPDAEPVDALLADDASAEDAATEDATVPADDAATPAGDASVADDATTIEDATTIADATAPLPDAAMTRDATAMPDAQADAGVGSPDARSQADAGSEDDDDGCRCVTGRDDPTALVGLLALGAVLLGRRRQEKR